MKKAISFKSTDSLLETHPILSKTGGWFIKIIETSNNAFLVEAIDGYGRIISKHGSNSVKLKEEVEDLIKQNCE